jgi:hypothetical protein
MRSGHVIRLAILAILIAALPCAGMAQSLGDIPPVGDMPSAALGATPAPVPTPVAQPTNTAQAIAQAKALLTATCTAPITATSTSPTGIDAILDQTTNPTNLLNRSGPGSTGSTLTSYAYVFASYLWGIVLLFSVGLWFRKVFTKPEHFMDMLMGIEAKFFGIAVSMLAIQFASGEGWFQANNGPGIQVLSTAAGNLAGFLAKGVVVPNGSGGTATLSAPQFKISTPGDAFRTGTCLAWKTNTGPELAAVATTAIGGNPLQTLTGWVDGIAAGASASNVTGLTLIASIAAMAPFVILAFQLFLVKWAGIVFGAMAIVLLAFAVFEFTAAWAEPYWKFVIGNFMSTLTITFVAYFIAALMDAVQVRTFNEITSSATNSNFFAGLGTAVISPFTGDIDMIFIALFATGIALSTPSLTSILTSGSGGLSGGNLFAIGAATTGALMAGLGAAVKGLTALTKATQAGNMLKDGLENLSKTDQTQSGKLNKVGGTETTSPTPQWNADAPNTTSDKKTTAGDTKPHPQAPHTPMNGDLSGESMVDAVAEHQEAPVDMDALQEEAAEINAEVSEPLVANANAVADAVGESTLASDIADHDADLATAVENAEVGKKPAAPKGSPRLAALKDNIASVRDAAQKATAATATPGGVAKALESLSETLGSFAATTAAAGTEIAKSSATAGSDSTSTSTSISDQAVATDSTTTAAAGTEIAKSSATAGSDSTSTSTSISDQAVATDSTTTAASENATSSTGTSKPSRSQQPIGAPTVKKAPGSRPAAPKSPNTPSARETREVAQTGIASKTLQSAASALAAAAPYATGAAAAPFAQAVASIGNAATILTSSGMTPASATAITAAQSAVAAATVSLAQNGNMPTPVAEQLGGSNAVLETEAAMVSAFAAQSAGGGTPVEPTISQGPADTVMSGAPAGGTAAPGAPPPPMDQFVDLMTRLVSGVETTMQTSTEAQTASMREMATAATRQSKAVEKLAKPGPQGSDKSRLATQAAKEKRETFLRNLDRATSLPGAFLQGARREVQEHHHAAAAPKTTGIHH